MNRLFIWLLSLIALTSAGRGFAAPAWIDYASKPGPDTAPMGQSRFAQLFRQPAGNYIIPYPFERLIETLEHQLDNGTSPAVRHVLVPRGRSLQRDTPAPDYFRFPRQVIALEGEPIISAEQAGQVMQYRLFIAHQPKTATLEVISYNDAAGRFEFQVVEAYDAGKEPRVRAANRVMCMSCHHNAAPIFPRIPWRETSFNVEVASRLVAALPRQYNSLIGVVTLDAGLIDVLVERANYLAAAQAIWSQGCASADCRAAIIRAALQYRLSGKSSFDSLAAGYQRDYVDELKRNWPRKWPQGLALPGSRLSDRDPFVAAPRLEDDPLMPRPAQAIWQGFDSILAAGIIYRLAGFFTRADIQRLDRHLIAVAESGETRIYRYQANCRARPSGANNRRLSCGDNAGIESLQAKFEFEESTDQIESLRIISLRIPGDSNLLQPDVIALTQFANGLEAGLGSERSRLSQRLANGDRINSMTLRWNESRGGARLEIEVSAEFEIIERALSAMIEKRASGHASSLREDVFRRKPVLRELMRELSMESLVWQPTVHNTSLPNHSIRGGLEGGLALFAAYCAHCHGDESLHPPGFLAGSNVQSRILQCAPRILRRLRAWENNSNFPRAPMPPPASIGYSGIDAADWPLHHHYRTLVTSVENLIIERHGRQQLLDWRTTNYAELPSCLASAR